MASNIQRGPRRMDAGDWIRLKRLRGARTFTTDTTTNPDPRLEFKNGRKIYTEVGKSRIRNPASGYTDYVASQTVDYILEQSDECGAKALTVNKLCTCDTTSAIKHNGLCRSCTYDRIVNRNTSGTCVLGTNQNCNACGDACPQGTVCVPPKAGFGGYTCVEVFPTSFTIPSNYCSMSVFTIVNGGVTYDIINNTDTTEFRIENQGSIGLVTIPLGGPNSVQMPSGGILICV